MGDVGVPGVLIRLIVFNRIHKMDSKSGFEMSLIVVEAIRGRCASFTVLTATVWEIFGGQTNSSILVLLMTRPTKWAEVAKLTT